jgi:hypothetical protein
MKILMMLMVMIVILIGRFIQFASMSGAEAWQQRRVRKKATLPRQVS